MTTELQDTLRGNQSGDTLRGNDQILIDLIAKATLSLCNAGIAVQTTHNCVRADAVLGWLDRTDCHLREMREVLAASQLEETA